LPDGCFYSLVTFLLQDVLQWGIFKDLGKLDSSSRFFEEDGSVYPYQEHTAIAENKIGYYKHIFLYHTS
jgi:hypothetical protein